MNETFAPRALDQGTHDQGDHDQGDHDQAWAPFCSAIEAVWSWEQSHTVEVRSLGKGPARSGTEAGNTEQVQISLVEKVDALGRLGAVLEDGEVDEIPLSELFRFRGMPHAEQLALDLCRGRVLDVGAGSGVHALALQQGGIQVTTLDAQHRLVDVQRSRGVDDARCGDILSKTLSAAAISADERWDTILLMMNGLGLCGDTAGLVTLLERLRSLLNPGGSILADGCDLRLSPAPEEADRIALRREAGRQFGEARLQMCFAPADGAPIVGAHFPWLYVDSETLQEASERTGFDGQIVFDSGPDYLARLTLPTARS